MQALLDAIHASGEDQVCAIKARAQAQVQEILDEAQVQARPLREESRATASAPTVGERTRILHQAHLEAGQIVGEVREALVDKVLSQTGERLAGIRMDGDYPAALRRLIEEALAELYNLLKESERAELVADPRDRELLEGALLDMGRDLRVSYELDCWGGLIAKSEDGRVIAINTLEARLERATPYLRRTLATLFEEG